MTRRLMCHVVAGYPDAETCLELLIGMQQAGVVAIEVQIPFSDPIADGETIMRANDIALENGMTTAKSFELIQTARKAGVDVAMYVMSYMQKVSHFGIEAFCTLSEACGISGLIIPDLPYDSPDYVELLVLAKKHGLTVVPVLSPGMSPQRLEAVLKRKPSVIYVTTQRGITGKTYSGGASLATLCKTIHESSEAELLIGFGISTVGDVRDALKHGDVAVVGSAVINQLQKTSTGQTINYIKTLVGSA